MRISIGRAGLSRPEFWSQDNGPAANDPFVTRVALLARVARLIGLPYDETHTLALLMFVDSVEQGRSDVIVGRNRGAPTGSGREALSSIDDVLRRHGEGYNEAQRAELARMGGVLKSEYPAPVSAFKGATKLRGLCLLDLRYSAFIHFEFGGNVA